jgi:hypothetical protein
VRRLKSEFPRTKPTAPPDRVAADGPGSRRNDVLDVPMELMPTPSTSGLDLVVAAGGFEGGVPIDDGGGGTPTAGELRIKEMRERWDGEVTERNDTTLYYSDGAMFYDSDGNGYYDYLEVATDTGHFIYDPETDTWTWRQNDDRDPD